MISTLADFRQEIAWDQTILERAMLLSKLSSRGVDLDLRTGAQTIYPTAVVSMGGGNRDNLLKDLLPLLFGAAWKILDVTVEFALANAGRTPPNQKRWTIDQKVIEIANHGSLPGLRQHPDIWGGLRSLYINTKEVRHALVHRQVKVNGVGELIGIDKSGRSLTPLTVDEQRAFCGVVARLTDGVLNGTVSKRVEDDLRSHLARLQQHLGGTSVARVAQFEEPLRVADDFPGDSRVDVPSYWDKIKRTHPNRSHVDLELTLSDQRVVIAELEQAPRQVIAVDLNALPPWMRWI